MGNVYSFGKPDLMFKSSKAAASKNKCQDRYKTQAFDCDGVKIERPCVPLVEKKTREREPKTHEHNYNYNKGDDVKESYSESCKTKKRKVENSVDCEFAEKKGICVLNEVSYDHIEHAENNLSYDNGLIIEENDSLTKEGNQHLTSTITKEARNCLNPDSNEKRTPIKSVIAEAKTDLSSENGPRDDFNELSMPPINEDRRIPSGRNIIDANYPASQTRLCLAVNSMGHYVQKRKHRKNKAPINKPKDNNNGDKRRSRKKGKKKSRISLPRLTSECDSIQVCSESSVAFTQWQMREMKFVAFKLMDELKSMKRIVEGKLVGEKKACCCLSLKSNADEVKMAIGSATTVERKSRLYLSRMAKNCDRFCKIMTMIEKNDGVSTKAIESREKKKISFADEAGGMLCDVKLFENGEACLEHKTENQVLKVVEH